VNRGLVHRDGEWIPHWEGCVDWTFMLIRSTARLWKVNKPLTGSAVSVGKTEEGQDRW